MANDKFSIQEALTFGWTLFKQQPIFFVAFGLAQILFNIIVRALRTQTAGAGGFVNFLITLLVFFGSTLLAMYLLRILLIAHDEGRARMPTQAEIFPFLPRMLGAQLFLTVMIIGVGILFVLASVLFHSRALIGVLFILGFVLFVFLMVVFGFYGFVVMDKGVGPMDAFAESKRLTNGNRSSLFLFFLAVALLNIGGLLCLLVGFLVSFPVSLLAGVYVYRRLSVSSEVA